MVVTVGFTEMVVPESVPGDPLYCVRVPIPGTTVSCALFPLQIAAGVAEMETVALLLSDTVPLKVVVQPVASVIRQL